MRWSQYYIPTLKEAPADAEVISHQLLTRAGLIRKLASGIYSYLPLGLRAIRKVERIVREEMDASGAQEVLLPAVQPSDLWVESGRWTHYGKELLRFKDRHDRDCCLGPTHEEAITDLIRGEVRSYRQLPFTMYQIQTKFRDEIRPRFGLMRGREFIMKDAYSFDCDDAGADLSYKTIFDAYERIFSRLGLCFRAVEADSGSIGGSFSHEFMVLAGTGEDSIAACTACKYAANMERAEVGLKRDSQAELGLSVGSKPPQPPAYTEIFTPKQHTVAEVVGFLKAAGIAVEAQGLVKTILLDVDGKLVAALVRGDHELNEIKIKNRLSAKEVRLASPAQVRAWTGAPVGFAGPVGLNMPVLADHALSASLMPGEGWVTGANKADAHFVNVSLARDAGITEYADLRCIQPGDPCPRCGGTIETMRGIEVGHIFKLGLKYSEALKATVLDENGKERFIVMGCYGIGVSRVLAACIEQNHDESGIMFPPPVAPFEVMLANLDSKSEEAAAKAEGITVFLQAEGLDVLLDDRDERPGVKFKDADLIGAPMQLVVGAKSLARGIVEAKSRVSGRKIELPLDGFAEAFRVWRSEVYAEWNM